MQRYSPRAAGASLCLALSVFSASAHAEPAKRAPARQSSANVSTQIGQFARWAQLELGRARTNAETKKARCLDSALSQLHAVQRSALSHELALRGPAAGRRGAQSGLKRALSSAQAIHREAWRCGAQLSREVVLNGDGYVVRVWVDPRVARYAPLYPLNPAWPSERR